jgi:Tfp pilus assembly PilM family ATPase
LCHIGATESLISIVSKEDIVVHRYVPWGTRALIRQLQVNLDFSSDEDNAKTLLKEYGLSYEDRKGGKELANSSEQETSDNIGRTIHQITAPYLEELTNEIHNIIAYAKSQDLDSTFGGSYIYGEATLVRHLDRYLEKRLAIPVHLVNPFTQITLSENCVLTNQDEGASFVLALGLAVRNVPWL